VARARQYWLMKSEPDVYSIDDLKRDQRTSWDGVRNFRARNFMRDQMRVGDLVLFYHSNADPPGVASVARVCREAHPDATQFDRRSKYHDPKATRAEPRWFLVDIEFVEKFPRLVPLDELKQTRALQGMLLTQRCQRLSVQPVDRKHFETVRKLGRR
jgi:predicted RNA-binding protein with PUA-like domain